MREGFHAMQDRDRHHHHQASRTRLRNSTTMSSRKGFLSSCASTNTSTRRPCPTPPTPTFPFPTSRPVSRSSAANTCPSSSTQESSTSWPSAEWWKMCSRTRRWPSWTLPSRDRSAAAPPRTSPTATSSSGATNGRRMDTHSPATPHRASMPRSTKPWARNSTSLWPRARASSSAHTPRHHQRCLTFPAPPPPPHPFPGPLPMNPLPHPLLPTSSLPLWSSWHPSSSLPSSASPNPGCSSPR